MEKRFGCDRTVIKGRSPLTHNNCKSMQKWTTRLACLNNKWKSWDIYLLSFDTAAKRKGTILCQSEWLRKFGLRCSFVPWIFASNKEGSPFVSLSNCVRLWEIFGDQCWKYNYFWNVKSHFFLLLQKSSLFLPNYGTKERIIWTHGDWKN